MATRPSPSPITLAWDHGGAYDLFISLAVLHNPERFGLRPSWAAGVRSRLPAEDRQALEMGAALFSAPLAWLAELPQPKDAAAALRALSALPPAARMPALAAQPARQGGTQPNAVLAALAAALAPVGERRGWGERDRDALRAAYRQHEHPVPPPAVLEALLDAWSDLPAFGERYLHALQTYVDVFFAEEEQHMAASLSAALQQAQELAARLALPDLLEHLSQGVRFALPEGVTQVILAPSYWSAPLVFTTQISPACLMVVFGARPPGVSLAPGGAVPDALLTPLKTLADPTRLQILRFLGQQPLAPAEIARRLRLRPPTVTHHLAALRLAGLVSIHLGANDGGASGAGPDERRYTLRRAAIPALAAALDAFLRGEEESDLNTSQPQ